MLVPNRNYQSPEYRYGFNGMEKDDEIKGDGNSYDFGARIYDNRVGRWLSTDPLEHQYVFLSSYQFVANSPLMYIDPNGKEIIFGKNKASQKLKKQYEELRKNSKSFRALYDYLDSLDDYVVTIVVDDEFVNNKAIQSGVIKSDLNTVEGLFYSGNNTIYLKEESGSGVISEETFHATQKYVNEICGGYQNIPDKEAESKLFNLNVLDEEFDSKETNVDDGATAGRAIVGEENMPFNFSFNLGIEAKDRLIDTQELQGYYEEYVKEFYKYYVDGYGEKKHPYNKQKPSLGTPDTYNKIQNEIIKQDEREKEEKKKG